MLIKVQNKAVNFYELITFYINYYLKSKIWEFLFIYINFFSIIFFYFLYLYSKKEAVEFLLIYNFIGILTLSLSANARNISILYAGPTFAKGVIKFRLYSSLAIIFFIFFLKFFFFTNVSIFFLSINLLTLSFWVIEPLVTLYEIKKINLRSSIFLILTHLFFCAIFSLIFFFYRQKNTLILFLFIISCINIFYLLFSINSKLFKDIKSKYKKNKFNFRMLNLAFVSSIFIITSVFLIRYLLSEKLDHNLAADVIFCLSIVSFPGSLITGFYGAKYLNKDIILPSIFKYIFIFGLVLFFISAVILSINFYPSYNNFLKLFCISLIGSFIMFIAQIFRILHIGSKNMQSVFLKDVFFHTFLLFLAYLSILYFNVYLLFFIYPLMALIVYCSIIKLYDFDKQK